MKLLKTYSANVDKLVGLPPPQPEVGEVMMTAMGRLAGKCFFDLSESKANSL